MTLTETIVAAGSTESARLASKERRWNDAGKLWRAAIAERGPTLEAMVGLGTALREQKMLDEADDVWAEAAQRYPGAPGVASGRAWVAVGRRDWVEALRRWNDVRERFPDERAGYLGKSIALRSLGRFAEAEELLGEATGRFVSDISFGLDHAMLAERRRDWTEALARHRDLSVRFPGDVRPVAGVASALRELGRLDEAEAYLSSTVSRFPDAVDLLISRARLATLRRDWPEAFARWDKLVTCHPQSPYGYHGLGAALRDAGLFGLADVFLQTAVQKFPGNADVAAEYGAVPLAMKDWELAVIRGKELAARHPTSARVQSHYGLALLSAGRYDEADWVLSQAGDRFPDHLGIRINRASLANARSRWPEALDLWEALLAAHPENGRIQRGLGAARFGQIMSAADRDGAPAAATADATLDERRPAGTVRDQLSPVDLVKKFEGLGQNCEFGLFQRAVGAEPLGLLRFAGIGTGQLVAALDRDFEGVGHEAFTRMHVSADNEYVTSDTRFGMVMHTFIQASKVPRDATYASMLRRLTFLRRKLLEDLKDGEKILVHKDYGNLSSSEMMKLRRAIGRHGDGTLLIVRVTEDAALHGTVRRVDDALLEGFIDRHGKRQGRWDIPVDGWLDLCRRAYSLVMRTSRFEPASDAPPGATGQGTVGPEASRLASLVA